MDAKDSAPLRQRKNQIEMTLRHLENERREVEDNTDWINQAAYHRRASLLDQIAAWYREELEDIDRAIQELTECRDVPRQQNYMVISNSSILR